MPRWYGRLPGLSPSSANKLNLTIDFIKVMCYKVNSQTCNAQRDLLNNLSTTCRCRLVNKQHKGSLTIQAE